jgi:hypothetical protein
MDPAGSLENRPRMPSSPKGAVEVFTPRDRRKETQDLPEEDGLVAGRHQLTRKISARQTHAGEGCHVRGADRRPDEGQTRRERAG